MRKYRVGSAIGMMAAMGVAVISLVSAIVTTAAAADGISFQKTVVDPAFRSEGVAVTDFDGDGTPDIAVGSQIYLGPDWKRTVPIVEDVKVYDPKGYSDAFWCMAADLNGDGRPDLIVNRIPGQATDWFENPGSENFGKPWKRHLVTEVMSNENPIAISENPPRILCGWSPDGNADSEKRQVVILSPAADPYAPWQVQAISRETETGSQRYDHGIGFGDVNGDGRKDVVAMGGWYENPGRAAPVGPWKLHAVPISEPCAQMIVHDFNGDGRADILTSSAHNYGFWWHEQNEDGTFATHEIDKADSQLHSLEFVDIDGDGQPEAVVGKRWQAHWQGDPGWDDPAVVLLYWKWECRDGQVTWTKHTIDADSGVGIQFTITDINGDGKLDIIVSNKKGVFVFEQE